MKGAFVVRLLSILCKDAMKNILGLLQYMKEESNEELMSKQ